MAGVFWREREGGVLGGSGFEMATRTPRFQSTLTLHNNRQQRIKDFSKAVCVLRGGVGCMKNGDLARLVTSTFRVSVTFSFLSSFLPI